MTNNEFKLWLQGYFQLEDSNEVLSFKQLNMIKNHLNLAKVVDGYIADDYLWLYEALTTISENDKLNPVYCQGMTKKLKALIV